MYGVARNVDSSTLKTILQALAQSKENGFTKSARTEVSGANETPAKPRAKLLKSQSEVQETSFFVSKKEEKSDKSQLITKNERKNPVSKIMSQIKRK